MRALFGLSRVKGSKGSGVDGERFLPFILNLKSPTCDGGFVLLCKFNIADYVD